MATRSQVSGLPGITFHPQGLTSQAKLQDDGRENFTTIHQSMIDLGVSWVDVLKMDIEGEEWVVMLEMLESGMDMPFTQILIGELACARSESACCASPHLAWLSTLGVMVQAVCQFGLVANCKLVVHFFLLQMLCFACVSCLHLCKIDTSPKSHNTFTQYSVVELPDWHGFANSCNARANVENTGCHALPGICTKFVIGEVHSLQRLLGRQWWLLHHPLRLRV